MLVSCTSKLNCEDNKNSHIAQDTVVTIVDSDVEMVDGHVNELPSYKLQLDSNGSEDTGVYLPGEQVLRRRIWV